MYAQRYNGMEMLIRKMICELRERVVKEVPETGDFSKVSVKYENPDKTLTMSHLLLWVANVPEGSEGYGHERYMEFVLYNLPSPYYCRVMIGRGSKEDIVKLLDDEGLVQRLLDKLPRMAEEFRHIP